MSVALLLQDALQNTNNPLALIPLLWTISTAKKS
jgi:hypothetical protein